MSRKPEPPITRETWTRFGLPAPETEVRVCDDRLWRVDFCWLTDLFGGLAVEVHGGMWTGGAHARSPKDFAKGHRCTLRGWYRLEFTTRQVTSGYAPAVIAAWFRGERNPVLPPDPEDRRKKRKEK